MLKKDYQPVTNYLKAVGKIDPHIAHVDLIDSRGLVTASSMESKIGDDKSQHGAFLGGKEGVHYRDLHLSSSSQKPAFGVSVPIEVGGEFLGVMFLDMNADKLFGILTNEAGFTDVGEVYLVNKEGLMVSPSIYRQDVFLEQTINSTNAQLCSTHKHEKHNEETLTKNSTFTNYAGVEVLGTHNYIEETQWCLLMEIDRIKALSRANLIAITTTMVQTVLIMVSLGLLWTFITRYITKPITLIRQEIDKISQGNFKVKLEIHSRDEIGQLASAFNQMSEKITISTRQIKEDQARLVAAISDLPVGFLMLDLDQAILLANKAVKTILGISKNKYSFTDINKLLKPRINLKQSCKTSAVKKRSIEYKEVEFSDQKYIRVCIVPIIMIKDHEEVIGNVVLFNDITEEKILNRTRDEFFAVASHELRTPLTSIRGNASLIQDYYSGKINDKEIMEIIDNIHDSSILLIGIVQDFLDVSSLEQKRVKFKIEKFNIVKLAQETAKELKILAENKKLKIIISNRLKSIIVNADKSRTQQVIKNLVSNSIKFSNKGKIRVEFEKQKNKVLIVITDPGIGIALKNQKMLFRKFTQAGHSTLTRDATQGTGLGLYISKMIVEGMGGKIYLQNSSPSKGSTFVFELPTK